MVPGTTVALSSVDSKGRLKLKGERSFVGGVSDGLYGLAAFDFARGPVTAKKAWFFFDDEYVCLGSGITAGDNLDVVTTVNQCHRRGDVIVAGKSVQRGLHEIEAPTWVHHDGVAYIFPQPGSVRISCDIQKGSWRRINQRASDDEVAIDIFKLWLDHGSAPKDATYAYIVAPALAAADVSAYVSKARVTVLANTDRLQAVMYEKLALTAAAFYEPGRVDLSDGSLLAVDKPCLALIRGTKTGWAISLSNPENQQLTVQITLTTGDKILRKQVHLPTGPLAGSSVTINIAR